MASMIDLISSRYVPFLERVLTPSRLTAFTGCNAGNGRILQSLSI